jgi:Transglycosylase
VGPFPAPPGRAGSAPVAAFPEGKGEKRGPLGGRRRLVIGGALAAVALAAYPWAVGTLAARMVASRASARLGRTVTVDRGRGGFGRITLEGVRVAGAEGGGPLLVVDRVVVPFNLALGGRGPVRLAGLRAGVVRGGPADNVTAILDRFRKKASPAAAGDDAGGGRATLPAIALEGGSVEFQDAKSGLAVAVGDLQGQVTPGEKVALQLRRIRGRLALGSDDKGPTFGADEVDVQGPLVGLRPAGVPLVRVEGGHATPLPSLALTGIAGVIAPPPAPAAGGSGAPAAGVIIDLRGSYGGARETLWTAKGRADTQRRSGTLSLRAEQFSLDKIADVLPRSVLTPAATSLDAAFDLNWVGDAVKFGGDVALVGLSLQHGGLAAAPIENVSMGLTVRGTAYPGRRRLEIERVEASVRDITARLSGTIELPAGTYRFANGSKLGMVPKIDIGVSVPRIPCAKLLASMPEALTPKLQGFVLKGMFEAAVAAKVDFANLDALELHGKVGIDGCKVVKAPDAVAALEGPGSLVINVDVPPPPGAGMAMGDTETLPVVVGPDNPDFAPYDQISPFLVGSIMTTEDNGFFKHRGWVTSEFKSALRRNLERGGFRLGASSITMQMVKNVLLSQEKTLSRKLQELFLVWYLEQKLPKERILELYFNAIEFGPRIYGIGAATRHYFGKRPSELTPLEAAFFSSILPSPKRRYIQYCHGALYPPWDKYVHRIMAKVHERGRITDEEFAAWSMQPLAFDRREATFTEKQCLDWVKTITAKPEPEAPPDIDDEDASDEGAAPWPQKRLHRLFVRGAGKRAPTQVMPARASKSVAARAQ